MLNCVWLLTTFRGRVVVAHKTQGMLWTIPWWPQQTLTPWQRRIWPPVLIVQRLWNPVFRFPLSPLPRCPFLMEAFFCPFNRKWLLSSLRYACLPILLSWRAHMVFQFMSISEGRKPTFIHCPRAPAAGAQSELLNLMAGREKTVSQCQWRVVRKWIKPYLHYFPNRGL